MSRNQWSYDTAQPPLVYNARIGGKRRRDRLGRRRWKASGSHTTRARAGRSTACSSVIDRTEHPPLRPGQPVVVYPSSIGGLNYSPASFDPGRNIIINAAAETSAILTQQRLTPTRSGASSCSATSSSGSRSATSARSNPNWRDYGSISAIDVNTGRRVWKFKTPEPERGGVTTTASGLGFAGGGDGVVRAFDLRNGRVLWTIPDEPPDRGRADHLPGRAGANTSRSPLAGRPRRRTAAPATELHVFALGGSKNDDPPPPRTLASRSAQPQQLSAERAVNVLRTHRLRRRARDAHARRRASQLPGSRPRAAWYVQAWNPNSSNTPLVTRPRSSSAASPVRGARVAVGGYVVPVATDARGRFRYPINITEPRRYVVRVAGRPTARPSAGAA